MMEIGWFRYPLEGPMIIGGDEYVTVDELVKTVIDASGKKIAIEHIEGPVGVHARNFKQRNIAQVKDQVTGVGGGDESSRGHRQDASMD